MPPVASTATAPAKIKPFREIFTISASFRLLRDPALQPVSMCQTRESLYSVAATDSACLDVKTKHGGRRIAGTDDCAYVVGRRDCNRIRALREARVRAATLPGARRSRHHRD